MITPEQAQKRIQKHVTVLPSQSVGLMAALGQVLAADVKTRTALPPFDNSAMDGFAVLSADTSGASADQPITLEIRESIFAGDAPRRRVTTGVAARIMTGAAVPPGADAIVPREKATVAGDRLMVFAPAARGAHIRRCGEDAVKGTVVARAGTVLHPGVVAGVASAGANAVRVVRKPCVTVIATGDETVDPGSRLPKFKIYDSNSYMLEAALRQLGIDDIRVRRVGDNAGALSNAVRAALERSDVVILSGGVSVGDRDYVRDVLERRGVKQVFWRVRQKPGKPLYFGVKGRRLVFGLPGNPSSAFMCFYVYVYPALRTMSGHAAATWRDLPRPIAAGRVDESRWRYLKTHIDRDGAPQLLPNQGSHMVTSLTDTNAILAVPPGAPDASVAMSLPYREDEK